MIISMTASGVTTTKTGTESKLYQVEKSLRENSLRISGMGKAYYRW